MAYSDPVTDKQINYIKILIADAFLFQSDFEGTEYYRKKRMERWRADELIKLGCSRRKKEKKEIASRSFLS